MAHSTYLQLIISLGEHNPQLAGWLASFSISHTPFHFRKLSTSGRRKSSRGLPTKEVDKGGDVIPNEGEGDSQAHQSIEEALFGCSWVLKDSGKLLPLTTERKQELSFG